MSRLILIGPPGAGKGTQGRRLASDLQIPAISTGDILRDKRNENSELGRQVNEIISSGGLVPDEVVIDIIRDRIQLEDCRDGFILDGFPRTVAQADALERMLEDMELELDAVIYLRVEEDQLIERLSGRRVAPGSKAQYHIKFSPPKQEGVCDISGETLIQREDDRPETVKKRFEEYRKQTGPVIDYYERKGLLRTIEGQGDMDHIYQRIREVIGK